MLFRKTGIAVTAGTLAAGAVCMMAPAAHAQTTTLVVPTAVSMTTPSNATLSYTAVGAPAVADTLADFTVTANTAYNVTVASGTTSGKLESSGTPLASPLSLTEVGVNTLVGSHTIGTSAVKVISSAIPNIGIPYESVYSQPTAATDAPGTYTATLTFTAATGT